MKRDPTDPAGDHIQRRHTGHLLRLAGIVAALAAVRAVSLARATVDTVVLRPLDQGAPPVLPGRFPLS